MTANEIKWRDKPLSKSMKKYLKIKKFKPLRLDNQIKYSQKIKLLK